MYMILPVWVNPAGVSERVGPLAVTIHQCQIGTWVKWPICRPGCLTAPFQLFGGMALSNDTPLCAASARAGAARRTGAKYFTKAVCDAKRG